MYICVLDADGQVRVHRNGPATPEHFLSTIAPYREDLVVAVECIFTWYWLADLCAREGIAFVLGHALYMKAIHGGKAKNDKIDAHKIAVLLRGGMLPMAYVYPREMRATRDLLRRRCHFMSKRAELLTHIQNTASQYLLPAFGKKLAYHGNRTDVAARFPDPEVRKSIETNLALLDHYDRLLTDLELHLTRTAKVHDINAFYRLRSVPGIGKILALVLLYEIHDIRRFPTVQDFTSYCRLVKCGKESDGKHYGYGGAKIGNAHLKWAFSEAAVLGLRQNLPAQQYVARLAAKHGKAKALSIFAHKLGRAVYYMLRRGHAFDAAKFFPPPAPRQRRGPAGTQVADIMLGGPTGDVPLRPEAADAAGSECRHQHEHTAPLAGARAGAPPPPVPFDLDTPDRLEPPVADGVPRRRPTRARGNTSSRSAVAAAARGARPRRWPDPNPVEVAMSPTADD
jgi:transposase